MDQAACVIGLDQEFSQRCDLQIAAPAPTANADAATIPSN